MSATLQHQNIPVARPFIGEEEEQAVVSALRSGWVSQGPKVAEFERQFAAYTRSRSRVPEPVSGFPYPRASVERR